MIYICISNSDYNANIAKLLDSIHIIEKLQDHSQVLIKPNLVEDVPPPVTTPADCVEAIVNYIKKVSEIKIVVAEGCGSLSYETTRPFTHLGYTKLAEKYDIDLIDLNHEQTVKLSNSSCSVFPEFHFPEIGINSFIISVPVLKAHTLADVTLGMKNMMGFAPPKYYSKDGWKKSTFHSQIDRSIVELNMYRKPDLTIIDATTGLSSYHLGGPECDPPVNRLVAGYDVVEVDAYGAELLGFKWNEVGHIKMAHELIGSAKYKAEEL